MTYWKVTKAGDGVDVFKWRDKEKALVCVRQLVQDELYTKKELDRLFLGAEIRAKNGVVLFVPVDIPKSKVFWSFGCRFPFHEYR